MVTPASIKEKILTNQNSSKEKIINQLKDNSKLNNDSEKHEDFRLIMNGLFQAEGHIGGELPKLNTISFIPIVYISLNASDKSIELFKNLNSMFNNKLNYQVSLNKSGIFHIRIYTKNWDLIINKWIPYFNNCYGDKQRGLKILRKLYYIKNNKLIWNDDIKIKFIYLVYNIVDNSQRKLSLNEKINLVIPNVNLTKNQQVDLNYLKTYLNNTIILYTPKMSIQFILGFYLGDGTFNIFIRHEGKSLWYNPCLRISQKFTKDNDNLLKLILLYLESLGIKSNLSYPKNNTMVLLTIESIVNMKLLQSEFNMFHKYYYNKSSQMYLLEKACLLFGKVKFWREGNHVLLSLIYNYKDINLSTDINNLDKSDNMLNYKLHTKIVNDYFDSIYNDNYFISLYKHKAWIITLPINIKPKQKYITFINSKSKIIMDKTEALNKAKDYRDKSLKNWLIENKLI